MKFRFENSKQIIVFHVELEVADKVQVGELRFGDNNKLRGRY